MNAQKKATRKRIKAITSQLEDEFGLSGFLQITHIFDEGHDGDNEMDAEGAVSIYGTTAVTTPLWEYRAAKIRWYLGTASGQTDDDLTQVAIHEYIHVLLAPVTTLVTKSDHAGKMEEYVTESIMRVIGHARRMEDVH